MLNGFDRWRLLARNSLKREDDDAPSQLVSGVGSGSIEIPAVSSEEEK